MNDFFYKYRPIFDPSKPEKELSIKSLFNCEAAFSNRHNFNDLFDSKINLVRAGPPKIKTLKNKLKKKERIELASLIKKGRYTQKGNRMIDRLSDNVNLMIDNYYFYCLSSKNNSNLMWSHYANSHKGFCIEFKARYFDADKVVYENEIPQIRVSDLIIQQFQPNSENLGITIWKALRTKLKEWEYEDEYRFQASNSMISRAIKSGKNYKIFNHPAQFIESIIFGCRTDTSVKDYIIENIPFECSFKQAYESTSSILIKRIT